MNNQIKRATKMQKEKVIKQSIGIDCGKVELVVAFGVMLEGFEEKIISNTAFKNNPEGFKKLQKWAGKLTDKTVEMVYIIEATGVYHEKVSLHLHNEGHKICVMLPNKVKAFSQTLSVKTVNDKTSAQAIAYLGAGKEIGSLAAPSQSLWGTQAAHSRKRAVDCRKDTVQKPITRRRNRGLAKYRKYKTNQATY
jgi:transposase